MMCRLYIRIAAATYRMRHPGEPRGCRHAELVAEVDRVRRLMSTATCEKRQEAT